MLIPVLDKNIKKAIEDYLTATELVDFLQIDIEEVVDVFEDKILDNLDDVLELIGLRGYENEDNG